jgi:hypothetical protein
VPLLGAGRTIAPRAEPVGGRDTWRAAYTLSPGKADYAKQRSKLLSQKDLINWRGHPAAEVHRQGVNARRLHSALSYLSPARFEEINTRKVA